ncbi:MAG: RNA polymerase sigma factor [Lachnospiraceae bacterium]|nr:RNA polymerase sigma factor [Lachnospiraceae bacterium]
MDKELFLQKVLDAEETLFHVSFSILHNEADCADAVQEAILKAYDNHDKLRDEALFKTWLVRIVINECYAMRRSAKRFTSYADYENNEQASLSHADTLGKYIREEYLDLYEAIEKLNDKERLCVTLFYFEDCSIAEIANILHIPEGTVKSRLNRARLNLKGLLGEWEDVI